MRLENDFNFDGEYATTTLFSIKGLEELGISKELKHQLICCDLVDFENHRYNIPENKDIDDIRLLIDFYIGTVLNHTSMDFLKEHILEIEMPEEFLEFASIFKREPLILWNDMYFALRYRRYNNLVIVSLEETFSPNDKELCFKITTD